VLRHVVLDSNNVPLMMAKSTATIQPSNKAAALMALGVSTSTIFLTMYAAKTDRLPFTKQWPAAMDTTALKTTQEEHGVAQM
jgi:hypothetical protein